MNHCEIHHLHHFPMGFAIAMPVDNVGLQDLTPDFADQPGGDTASGTARQRGGSAPGQPRLRRHPTDRPESLHHALRADPGGRRPAHPRGAGRPPLRDRLSAGLRHLDAAAAPAAISTLLSSGRAPDGRAGFGQVGHPSAAHQPKPRHPMSDPIGTSHPALGPRQPWAAGSPCSPASTTAERRPPPTWQPLRPRMSASVTPSTICAASSPCGVCSPTPANNSPAPGSRSWTAPGPRPLPISSGA